MKKIYFAILVVTFGFTTTTKLNQTKNINKDNYDLVILANLIRENLIETDNRQFTINDLKKIDSLNRISDNFDWVEMNSKGGYISVAFKYTAERKTNVELNQKELESLSYINLTKKRQLNQNNGEIRLDYGERFYRIKKIIVYDNQK